MALTYGDLINDVEGQIYSYGMQRDKVTSLTADFTISDTLLAVAEARQVDRGFIEIDSELMAVKDIDTNGNTVRLHPWGRGQRGTTAKAHVAGTKVTANPRFPRSVIAQKVQQALSACFPDLYRVGVDTTNVFSPGKVGYPLPAGVDSVISVSYELPGQQNQWQQLRRFRFNQDADPSDFPTGKSLEMWDSPMPGRALRVVYRASFGAFTDEATTLVSVGGQDRWADLLAYWSVANLLFAMESTRLQSDSVETQQRAEGTTVTQSTTVARQLLALFKQRVTEERGLLYRQHPPVQIRQF